MNNTYRPTLLAFAALGLLSAHAASAQTFTVYSTGVDSAGASLPSGTLGDPHYTLTQHPAGTSGSLQVLTSAYGFPLVSNGWLADAPDSAWIAPTNDPFLQTAGVAGYYDYQTTFDLTGLDPAAASLSGFWATDNFGTDILINGLSTGNVSNANNAYSAFSIGSGFHAGLNTLDFVVLDDGQSSTGLRVSGVSGTVGPAIDPVPEASTTVSFALLLALGLGGAVSARRKRSAAA